MIVLPSVVFVEFLDYEEFVAVAFVVMLNAFYIAATVVFQADTMAVAVLLRDVSIEAAIPDTLIVLLSLIPKADWMLSRVLFKLEAILVPKLAFVVLELLSEALPVELEVVLNAFKIAAIV